MNHDDDAAEAVDPKVIDLLIQSAVPEKSDHWRELREQYRITFHLIADRKGVTIRARGNRIEFDNKSLTWLWLLGFAGWKAFGLHGPHLVWGAMTGTNSDRSLRAVDPTYAEATADLETVLYAVREFPLVQGIEPDAEWPEKVPKVQSDKTGLDIQQQAAFDLTMIATAYILLHEVRHVMFNCEKVRPSAVAEELECDAFARKFILDNAIEYSVASGQKIEEVFAKRAAGIALGSYVVFGFTEEHAREGSAYYPPIADRLGTLFSYVDLPADHWFWNFAASLLVSIIVVENTAASIPCLVGRDLCVALVETIRQRHKFD